MNFAPGILRGVGGGGGVEGHWPSEEFFVWASREILLGILLDLDEHKTWYEYDGKSLKGHLRALPTEIISLANWRTNRKWRPTNRPADRLATKFRKISSFDEFCTGLQLLPLTKKRTMVLMHKIGILWYRGIMELDSAAEPRANATCDCRDFTHRCIVAISDCRFFDHKDGSFFFFRQSSTNGPSNVGLRASAPSTENIVRSHIFVFSEVDGWLPPRSVLVTFTMWLVPVWQHPEQIMEAEETTRHASRVRLRRSG